MTDPMELVGRADEKNAPGHINLIDSDTTEELLDLIAEMSACIREMVESLEDARTNVRAFAAPWAVTFARERGYPDGALHFAHYDILAEAGARMTDFTRYLPPAPGAEDYV